MSSQIPPLEPALYDLASDPEALAFFKSQTGIEEAEELKRHILKVQEKAYAIHGYPCIRNFSFLRLKISRLPAYSAALALAKHRQDAILLDIGCCFGNDARKAVVDGWPAENVVASDLRRGFWDAGHELFRSTSESFPATFIEGDIFDPDFISPSLSTGPPTRPSLSTLKSLTPLKGQISAIHASSFFHLFSEDQQRQAASLLASLLCSSPGSIIFGSHAGRPEKGLREESTDARWKSMFCHSPESWREMWVGKGGVYQEEEVRVDISLTPPTQVQSAHGVEMAQWIIWSITRL